jgi:L-lactate dehydrogenase complex protein LldG
MSAREEMLERIRKALGHPAPPGSASAPEPASLAAFNREGIMPHIAPTDCLPTFENEFKKVSGTPYRAATATEFEQILRKILIDAGAKSVVLTRNPLLGRVKLADRLRTWGMAPAVWPEVSPSSTGTVETAAYRDQCFAAEVGISGVDFVLAETGSLVLTSQTEGSQLASLAPPVHVALYRREQVLSSLDDVLEHLRVSTAPGSPMPGRSMVFITGTSRTADIEQILIRGVHGPREVHAILLEEACLAELGAAQS